MIRLRLPARRPSESEIVETPDGRRIDVMVGFSLTGQVVEVFVRDAVHTESDTDALLDDAAVAISRALQHGDTLESIALGMGRNMETGEPTSLLGHAVRKALEIERKAVGRR